MDAHSFQDDDYLQEDRLLRGEQHLAGASAGEILARVDLEVAFVFEKLLNLETLVMEIARRAADIEPLMREPQSTSAESVHEAFEFEVLYCIVDSETNELEKLVVSIQMDIASAESNGLGGRTREQPHRQAAYCNRFLEEDAGAHLYY